MIKLQLITALLFVCTCCFSQQGTNCSEDIAQALKEAAEKASKYKPVDTTKVSITIDLNRQVERQKREYNMRTFDKKNFDKIRGRFSFCQFETEKYTIIQVEGEDFYGERIEDNQKLFETHYTYWKSNLRLRSIAYKISNCIVGISKFFDLKGNVTQEIDDDKDFKYSVYDVADYIYQHDEVDIFKRIPIDFKNRNASIHRVSGGDTIYPYYQIDFTTKDDKGGYYRIDGTTGEVIRKRIGREMIINKPNPNTVEGERLKKEEAAKKKKGFFGW